MTHPLVLRDDYDGARVRHLARGSKNGAQVRRLLALAAIYDGASRSEAARLGGVTVQIVRDWVVRFNARGADGLVDGKAPGNRRKLNDAQRLALAELVERGPIPAVHGVVRWRCKDLVQWIHETFRISLDETIVGRELRAMGFAKLSARPRHQAQNEYAVEDFKKLPRRAGGDPGPPARRHRHRTLVGRRSARRPEDQADPPLGAPRHPPHSAARPANRFGLHLRRDLPEEGKGCRPRHALVRPAR